MLSKREMGIQLRRLRHDRDMSIAQVSDTLGIAKSTLGDSERGKRYPNLMETVKLSYFYGLKIDNFISGTLGNRKLRTPIERMRARDYESLER